MSVFFIPMIISNMAAGMVSMEYKFKGANFCTVTACASGAHAIGEAFAPSNTDIWMRLSPAAPRHR